MFIINNKDKGVIYCLKVNNFIIYIGKSFGSHRINERKKEHARYLKNRYHPNSILQELYDIFGKEKFTYEIIEHYDNITNEELNNKEIYYIDKFNTYFSGANLTIGGDTVTGMKHSDETKKVISEKVSGENNPFYGKTHTEETRRKFSEQRKGKKLNENQRKAFSTQWQKGVPKSEEHRKNISKGLKGRKYNDKTLKKMSDAKKGKKRSEESKLKQSNTKRKISDETIMEIFIRSNLENITNKNLGIEFGIGGTVVSNIKHIKEEYMRRVIETNIKELYEMANKIIKFEKDGCVPCQMVQNLLDEKGIEVEKINAFERPELSAQFDISSVPTTILLDDNGNEIQRSIGFKPDELEEIISKLQ